MAAIVPWQQKTVFKLKARIRENRTIKANFFCQGGRQRQGIEGQQVEKKRINRGGGGREEMGRNGN